MATHDPVLQRAARCLAIDLLTNCQYELQSLYRVRPELGTAFRARGERLRISNPFGERWVPYLMHQIAERPSSTLFVLRAVFGR